jgi:hypothetical protein
MIMRRRPLLRAAAIGGGAYLAGKKAGQRQADQQDTDWQPETAGLSGQEQAGAAAGGTGQGAPVSIPDQLNRLTALHEQGALTDDEFSSAKAKLLGI